MTLKDFHKGRLSELGIEPKRSLGQNFLISERVVQKIISSVQALNSKAILEIGPGTGALTERILTIEKPYQVIEMDKVLAEFWRQRGLQVTEIDALKLDWMKFDLGPETCLVSNLPYQIAARLVMELACGPGEINSMVLMFQKEVAERICAKPKTSEYGLLSVIAQLGFEVKKVCDAAPGDFYPAPKVSSRVLHFQRKQVLSPKLLKLVKALFANRRKIMLKQIPEPRGLILEELKKMGYNDKVRAEEIAPEDFYRLFKASEDES
jgi:16S rRNA (adenine1518-N6/adenine1519-N6)-dimethyltransferase